MPPKKTITKEQVVDAAFEIIRNGGADKLTARGIAKQLGMSVNPIYCEFKSMMDLEKAVFSKAAKLLGEYQEKEETGKAFLKTGLGYITFAQEERPLFQWMFNSKQLPEDFQKEQMDCFLEHTFKKIKDVEYFKQFEEKVLKKIIFELWVFVHGLAMLICQKAIDPIPKGEIRNMLSRMFKAILSTLNENQNVEDNTQCQ